MKPNPSMAIVVYTDRIIDIGTRYHMVCERAAERFQQRGKTDAASQIILGLITGSLGRGEPAGDFAVWMAARRALEQRA